MSEDQDWLAPWQANRPKKLTLKVELDEVQLRVPVRASARPGLRARPVLLAGLAYAGTVVVSLVLGMLGFSDLMMAAPQVIMAGILAVFFLRYMRDLVAAPTSLSCDGRTLREGELEIPLETVREVEIDKDDYNGRLVLHTDKGSHAVADGLFPGELDWAASLLRTLITRRLEQTEGHDAEQEAARRRALSALTKSSQTS